MAREYVPRSFVDQLILVCQLSYSTIGPPVPNATTKVEEMKALAKKVSPMSPALYLLVGGSVQDYAIRSAHL